MTFAADKCWICQEDCEAADWHYKLTAAGRKIPLDVKLSVQSGKSTANLACSPSLLTLFWLTLTFRFSVHLLFIKSYWGLEYLCEIQPVTVTQEVQRTDDILYLLYLSYTGKMASEVILGEKVSVGCNDVITTVPSTSQSPAKQSENNYHRQKDPSDRGLIWKWKTCRWPPPHPPTKYKMYLYTEFSQLKTC